MKTCVPIHNRIHNLENSTTKKEKEKFPKYFTKQKKRKKTKYNKEKKKEKFS